jgi:hypothetical protein
MFLHHALHTPAARFALRVSTIAVLAAVASACATTGTAPAATASPASGDKPPQSCDG